MILCNYHTINCSPVPTRTVWVAFVVTDKRTPIVAYIDNPDAPLVVGDVITHRRSFHPGVVVSVPRDQHNRIFVHFDGQNDDESKLIHRRECKKRPTILQIYTHALSSVVHKLFTVCLRQLKVFVYVSVCAYTNIAYKIYHVLSYTNSQ